MRISAYIILLLQISCFYAQAETVYENKNYKLSSKEGAIASIIVKVDYSPEQDNYTLIIGNPGGIVGFDGNDRALWFFVRTVQAKDFCKKNPNLSYNKKFASFLPFINNTDVEFSLTKEKRIAEQETLPFKVTTPGLAKIELELRVYVATILRKTETIEEQATIKITFQPSEKSPQAQKGGAGGAGGAAGGGGGGGAGTGPEEEKGKTPEEIEAARKDSIKRLTIKWESYFTEKNVQIKQLIQSIDQIDTAAVSKEEIKEQIEDYENRVNQLKKTADAQFQKRELLEENNELTDKVVTFESSCNLAIKKLGKWKTELEKAPPAEKDEEKINWLIVLGVGMMLVMAGVPIITQVVSSRKVKKMQKKQAEEAKRQADEAERARLLAEEDNAI